MCELQASWWLKARTQSCIMYKVVLAVSALLMAGGAFPAAAWKPKISRLAGAGTNCGIPRCDGSFLRFPTLQAEDWGSNMVKHQCIIFVFPPSSLSGLDSSKLQRGSSVTSPHHRQPEQDGLRLGHHHPRQPISWEEHLPIGWTLLLQGDPSQPPEALAVKVRIAKCIESRVQQKEA